jgi:hypothetical protein
LLGYVPFTPFLIPDISVAYNLAGIPTYPYFGSLYQTTFPYQASPGTIIPYARFDYPAYVYGSPDFYLLWVLCCNSYRNSARIIYKKGDLVWLITDF